MVIKSPVKKKSRGNEPVTAKQLRNIPRVSISELYYKLKNKTGALIVDTREESEYRLDHIEGAISAPLQKIIEGKWIPPKKDIILYCS